MAETNVEGLTKADTDAIEKAKSELVGSIVDMKYNLDAFIESMQQAPVGKLPEIVVFHNISRNMAMLDAQMENTRFYSEDK